MRLNQDRASVIEDIKRTIRLIENEVTTFEGHEDIKRYSQALPRWEELKQNIPNFDTASNRELVEYRRSVMNIADMATINLEGTQAVKDSFGDVLDRFQSHSTKWNRDVSKIFNKFLEIVPFANQGEMKYRVLDMITGTRTAKSNTDLIVSRLEQAYNRALAKVGNDNETELLVQFAKEFDELSKRGAVPKDYNPFGTSHNSRGQITSFDLF